MSPLETRTVCFKSSVKFRLTKTDVHIVQETDIYMAADGKHIVSLFKKDKLTLALYDYTVV